MAARIAAYKHQASQHPNKKSAVLDKGTSYYYRKKAERDSLLQTRRDKAVQAEMMFQSSDCPYPTQGAFQRAVRRVRGRIHATGKRFAFLFKGLLKSSDQKMKQEFNQLHVKYTTLTKNIPTEALRKHISSIKQKRDRKTLEHRRTLATLFKGSGDVVGLSKRFVEEAAKESPTYAFKQSKVQKVIGDFCFCWLLSMTLASRSRTGS